MRKALVLVLTVAVAGPALADTAQDGARYFQKGDYSHALAAWRPLADQGNAVAQNGLGIMYLDGKGVTQNTAEAYFWFALAAAAPASANQGIAAANRDALAAGLSANQIAAVQQRVRQWRPDSPTP